MYSQFIFVSSPPIHKLDTKSQCTCLDLSRRCSQRIIIILAFNSGTLRDQYLRNISVNPAKVQLRVVLMFLHNLLCGKSVQWPSCAHFSFCIKSVDSSVGSSPCIYSSILHQSSLKLSFKIPMLSIIVSIIVSHLNFFSEKR